jgi:uncharacterized protein with PQ loop repeat
MCTAIIVIDKKKRYRTECLTVVIVFWIYIAVVVVVIAFSIFASMFFGLPQQSTVTNVFAQIMGYIPVVLTFVQWTPQIFKTWKTKVSVL